MPHDVTPRVVVWQAKNQALRDAGAIVPTSFEDFEPTIAATYKRLVEEGALVPQPDQAALALPQDLAAAKKAGKVGDCAFGLSFPTRWSRPRRTSSQPQRGPERFGGCVYSFAFGWYLTGHSQ